MTTKTRVKAGRNARSKYSTKVISFLKLEIDGKRSVFTDKYKINIYPKKNSGLEIEDKVKTFAIRSNKVLRKRAIRAPKKIAIGTAITAA